MSSKVDRWIKLSGINPLIKKLDRHLTRCLSELMPEPGQRFWLVGLKGSELYSLPLSGNFFPDEINGNIDIIGVLEIFKGEKTLYKI